MDFQQAKDQITIQVITAYLSVLDNAELLNQVVNQLDVSKKQIERLTVLEKEGANKVPSDLYDLKGTYGDNQLNLVSAKSALEVSKLNLMQMLNIPYNKNLKAGTIERTGCIKQNRCNIGAGIQYRTATVSLYQSGRITEQKRRKRCKGCQGALLPTLTLGRVSLPITQARRKNQRLSIRQR
jgi:outer membrane protein